MRYAVELGFDEAADARVRALWRELLAARVPPAPFLTDAYAPHVSVASFETDDVQSLVPALRGAVSGADGLTLALPALGFFLDGGPARAYLGVTLTERLARLHRQVAAALAGAAASRPYYGPDEWTPHCTLPVEISDPAAIVGAVRRCGLPLRAAVAGVRLVELPSGAERERLL